MDHQKQVHANQGSQMQEMRSVSKTPHNDMGSRMKGAMFLTFNGKGAASKR